MGGAKLAEFVDQLGNRFVLDISLEVVVDGEVGYIEGNAHTFPGRLHVFVPALGYDVTRSLSELDRISDTARVWIDGFLAGCEPDVYAYLGIDPAVDVDADVSAEEYERWRAFNLRCRELGTWPQLNPRPRGAWVITAEEAAEVRAASDRWPWALAGERVWVPDGSSWVEVDPQPRLVDGFLAGTVCAEAGESDLADLDSGWTICLACGEVSPPDCPDVGLA